MTGHELGQRLLWVPMGGLLGAFSGALVGAVFLLGWIVTDPSDDGMLWALVAGVAMGVIYGGIAGFVVGLFVGAEMMFLLGTGLPRELARRRAYVLGLVLPPLTMLALVQAMALVSGGGLVTLSLDGADLGTVVLLAGSSLMGGRLARWLAGWQPPKVPVS